MTNLTNSLFKSCPIGCKAPFSESGILLPEGPLMECSQCRQFFLLGYDAHYNEAISKFDVAIGTCPDGNISKRLLSRTLKTIKRVERLSGKNKTTLKALDVGCSNGGLLRVYNSLGIDAQGVEPMPKPAKAAQKFGFKVHQGYLEDIGLPENSFNLITLFEVIEHLRHPIPLITECHRLLEKDGILVIRTGNTNSWSVQFMKEKWDYFCPEIGHISYFNPRSMRIIADRTGFTLEKIYYHSVSLHNKKDVSPIVFRIGKIIVELLNLPARIMGKGHEIEVHMRAV